MQDVCIQSLEGTVASPADMAAICNPAATQAVNVVLYDGRMVQLEEKVHENI
ncbi:hypothetical protein DPMN_036635 [Dreissena polymorpha]|uniref:Uncharacterized protein n=1 Tax=Dreissena polymorpha TaxID=45954 RepID=A0A9D4MBW1_DREPO|nr:hypothetical protein DPMN_036635 [Dreissena polymorpha]